MLGRSIAAAIGISLLATTAWAQVAKDEQAVSTEGVGGGVITDGTNVWRVAAGANPDDGILTDLEVPSGSDHQFSTWWWYRVQGDTAETRMPPPDFEVYSGDTAALSWNDVSGRGLFDAVLIVQIFNVPPGAVLSQQFQVTPLGNNVDLHVFHYTDMDMDGTAGNDSAAEPFPGRIKINDTSTAFFLNVDSFLSPVGYRVAVWPIVRSALNDTVIDNFASTGLPFGPADFGGAFQWDKVVSTDVQVPFWTFTCVKTSFADCDALGVVFSDGFESGDTSVWDSTTP